MIRLSTQRLRDGMIMAQSIYNRKRCKLPDQRNRAESAVHPAAKADWRYSCQCYLYGCQYTAYAKGRYCAG